MDFSILLVCGPTVRKWESVMRSWGGGNVLSRKFPACGGEPCGGGDWNADTPVTHPRMTVSAAERTQREVPLTENPTWWLKAELLSL